MKTKKEILQYLTDKLGLQAHFEVQNLNSDLILLSHDLSNLSEFPDLAAVLQDRNYLQKLLDEQKLIPCILMQSLMETASYAGVVSYKYELW